MRIIAIVQARMRSSRLPGKVLIKINGKAVVDHVVERLKMSKRLTDVVVAIADTKEDKELENHLKKMGYNYFVGSEDDVLDRFYQAAKKFKAELVVRITSDCPLIDPKLVDLNIEKYLDGGYDYVSNDPPAGEGLSFPRGTDVEVLSFKTLEKVHKVAVEKDDREHVTLYVRWHPEIFNRFYLKANGKLRRPDIRISLDTPQDLELINKLFEKLKFKKEFYLEDIIKIFEEDPSLLDINKDIKQKIPKRLLGH